MAQSHTSRPSARLGNVGARWRASQGGYLRDLRIAADLTQDKFAEAIGINSKQMVSQIENGRVRLPSDWIRAAARVYGVDEIEFTKHILRTNDPFAYAVLFGTDPELQEQINEATDRAEWKVVDKKGGRGGKDARRRLRPGG